MLLSPYKSAQAERAGKERASRARSNGGAISVRALGAPAVAASKTVNCRIPYGPNHVPVSGGGFSYRNNAALYRQFEKTVIGREHASVEMPADIYDHDAAIALDGSAGNHPPPPVVEAILIVLPYDRLRDETGWRRAWALVSGGKRLCRYPRSPIFPAGRFGNPLPMCIDSFPGG
jgi:hypothetical protein